jgi:S-formylglutathione hydrolase FrmB
MRSRLFVLYLFALAALLPAQRPGQGRGEFPGGGPAPREAVALEHFDYTETEFDAPSLAGGVGRVGLYVPKGHEAGSDRRYPLVVWLHGFGGFAEFQNRGAAEKLDAMRGEGAIPEIVVATFVAPGRGRRARSTYLDGERVGDVETAICKDLIVWLDENQPVLADRQHRAIMGISIGGFGALKIAMKHKDVFGVVAAHSAAVFPDDPAQLPERYQRQLDMMMRRGGLGEVFGDPIDKVKWAAEMPMGLVRNADEKAFANLAIYFDAGTEDRYGFADLNVALHELLDERKVAHTFRLVEGGGHAWSSDSMLPNLEQSLRFVGEHLGKVSKADASADDKSGADGKDTGGKDTDGKDTGGRAAGSDGR